MKKPGQRKPRFQRDCSSPPLRLTERDFCILTQIGQHRFLQSHLLVALIAGSRQHLIRRLGRLYHAGFVERPRQQLQLAGLVRSTFVYCLTPKAGKALLARGSLFPSTIPKLRSAGSVFSLIHDLLASEVVVAIRISALSNRKEFFWHFDASEPEKTERSTPKHQQMRWRVSIGVGEKRRSVSVLPDAAFVIADQDGWRGWFFLEFDRGTMPATRSDPDQSSFQRKILTYRETRRSGVLWNRDQIPGFRVLVVTESRKRLRSLQKVTADCFQYGESSMFLFACLKDLSAGANALGSVWQTCSGKVVSLCSE